MVSLFCYTFPLQLVNCYTLNIHIQGVKTSVLSELLYICSGFTNNSFGWTGLRQLPSTCTCLMPLSTQMWAIHFPEWQHKKVGLLWAHQYANKERNSIQSRIQFVLVVQPSTTVLVSHVDCPVRKLIAHPGSRGCLQGKISLLYLQLSNPYHTAFVQLGWSLLDLQSQIHLKTLTDRQLIAIVCYEHDFYE